MESQLFLWITLLLSCSIQLSVEQACRRSCRPGECNPDCTSVNPPVCTIPLDNGSFADIADPTPNRRSCFRTCIAEDPFGFNFSTCHVNRTAFENNRLVRQIGPQDQNAYSHFRLFSPGFGRGLDYRGNSLCRFHLLCNTEGIHEDSILTVTFQTHRLIPPDHRCGEGQEQCIDSVKMTLFGRVCTTCGDSPLRCMEEPDFPPLPSLITLSGNSSFMVQFKSNREDETRGFQFLTQCVERNYFNSPGCTIPGPDMGRRKRQEDIMDEYFPLKSHRMRRSYRVVWITVEASASVTYTAYTIRVRQGDLWLYKFQNVQYFQVHNVLEGYQTYCRSAPPGREFPGYGVLKIGRGIVQYIQTGVQPELIPSPGEAAIINNLYRRIPSAIEQPDIDTGDSFDEGTRGITKEVPLTDEEIREMKQQAMENGNACNGVLRATACLYQELFLSRGASSDCDL